MCLQRKALFIFSWTHSLNGTYATSVKKGTIEGEIDNSGLKLTRRGISCRVAVLSEKQQNPPLFYFSSSNFTMGLLIKSQLLMWGCSPSQSQLGALEQTVCCGKALFELLYYWVFPDSCCYTTVNNATLLCTDTMCMHVKSGINVKKVHCSDTTHHTGSWARWSLRGNHKAEWIPVDSVLRWSTHRSYIQL